jgi:AraC-like DNA-binding protein
LTNLNVRLLDENGFVRETVGSHTVPFGAPPESFLEADSMQEDTTSVWLVRDSANLDYLCHRADGIGLLLCGPFIGPGTRLRIPQAMPAGERSVWQEFIRTVPHKSREDVRAISALLRLSSRLDDAVSPASTELGENLIPAGDTDTPFGSDSLHSAIEQRYGLERRLRDGIARGEPDTVLHIIKSAAGWDVFRDRLPNDPIRLRKNLLIVMNTIGRLAAEKGGVHPVELHALSEKNAILIEGCQTTRDVDALVPRILLNYARAVRSISVASYSAPVHRAASYILHHLDGELYLDRLADIAGCSASYLSHRFHAETGQTVRAYIRTKRVDAARWFLKDEQIPITEVAFRVGFDDPNYFSKVFKAVMGVSATEYRRRQKTEHREGIP